MRIAAYARYSSDNQRDASLEDQLRNCRSYAQRQGWPEPVIFTDAAISGSRLDRPGYMRLRAEAETFDVILVDDLSRLSRDSIETSKALRRLTFSGVRLIGVSDGVDTSRKGHKIDAGLRGLMGELYVDDLAEKTHRGLTGRALSGASAGGLPYGYRVTETGHRSIEVEKAEVVRRIFTEYADGASPRAIAGGLNRDGIPSPRDGTWAMTAIRGDVRRGIGILANPIYVGRQVWNRSRWVKHPETGKRVRQERPESDWVTTEHPELAIVSPELWEAVQARQRGASKATGTAGRPPRHLLSGILRCGACGGSMVVIDRYNYGCNRAKDRGTCEGVRVNRKQAESAMLAGITADLLSEEAFQRFHRHANALLKRQAPDTENGQRRLVEAQRLQENVMAAIRAGIITPSTKAELMKAEAAVAEAERMVAALKAFQPATFLPRARERWQRMAADLSDARRSDKGRAAVQALIGTAIVRNENGDLIAEIAATDAQINLVAGACSVPYRTAPLLIPLGRASYCPAR